MWHTFHFSRGSHESSVWQRLQRQYLQWTQVHFKTQLCDYKHWISLYNLYSDIIIRLHAYIPVSEKHQTSVGSLLAGPSLSEYSAKYNLRIYWYGGEVMRRNREELSTASCESSECSGRHVASTKAQRIRSAGKGLAHISTCVWAVFKMFTHRVRFHLFYSAVRSHHLSWDWVENKISAKITWVYAHPFLYCQEEVNWHSTFPRGNQGGCYVSFRLGLHTCMSCERLAQVVTTDSYRPLALQVVYAEIIDIDGSASIPYSFIYIYTCICVYVHTRSWFHACNNNIPVPLW